jgi:hypothetical protein
MVEGAHRVCPHHMLSKNKIHLNDEKNTSSRCRFKNLIKLTPNIYWPHRESKMENEDELLKEDDDFQTELEAHPANDGIASVGKKVEKLQVSDEGPNVFPMPKGGLIKTRKPRVGPVAGTSCAPKTPTRQSTPKEPIVQVKRIMVSPIDETGLHRPPPKKKPNSNVTVENLIKLNKNDGSEFTEDDFKKFQTTLSKEIQDLHGSMKIKIQRLTFRDGYVSVHCVDSTTKLWIEAKSPRWNNGEYRIQEEDGSIKFSVFIYGDDVFDRSNFLKTIEEQNEVDTSKWRVLKVYPHKPKKAKKVTGHIVVIGVPDNESKGMEGRSLYYLFNEIKPKLWEKEAVELKDASDPCGGASSGNTDEVKT